MAANTPEISTIQLGHDGGSMPVLGFGTEPDPPVPAETTRAAVLAAIQAGYRHFDTACLNHTEQPLGEAIAQALEKGLIQSRDDLFITSKLWCSDAHRDLVLPALNTTLRKLNLEYVDLYLIHWPVNSKSGVYEYPIKTEDFVPMDYRYVWEAMEECKKLGLAKSIGVSNFSREKLAEILTFASIPPAVNQVEVNPLWQQKELREFCKATGVSVTTYSPLGSVGTFYGSNKLMESDVLKEIATCRNKSVAQVCLRWALEQGIAVVVKSFNKERMKQNLDIFDWSLSSKDHEKIKSIPQSRVCKGRDYTSSFGPFRTIEELWDGEPPLHCPDDPTTSSFCWQRASTREVVCNHRTLRNLYAMATSGKKSANWTNKEDDKLLDVLIEQKVQGLVKFEWSAVRVMLKNEGIDKHAGQIKNHFNDLVKKLRAWEYLIGRTGVGVDYKTGAVVVPDAAWEEFLLKYDGKYKSFRKKVLVNLDKVKAAFYGKHAIGEMSFAPGMVASGSNLNQNLKGLAIDTAEHMGDSDETNTRGSDDEVQCIGAEESRSPPRSVHNSRKRKSGGGNSSDSKRQELLDWSSRDDEVQEALAILRVREEARQKPSLFKQVQTRLKEHPVVSAMGTEFIWNVMEYIKAAKEESYFIDLDDEFVLRYIKSRGFDI